MLLTNRGNRHTYTHTYIRLKLWFPICKREQFNCCCLFNVILSNKESYIIANSFKSKFLEGTRFWLMSHRLQSAVETNHPSHWGCVFLSSFFFSSVNDWASLMPRQYYPGLPAAQKLISLVIWSALSDTVSSCQQWQSFGDINSSLSLGLIQIIWWKVKVVVNRITVAGCWLTFNVYLCVRRLMWESVWYVTCKKCGLCVQLFSHTCTPTHMYLLCVITCARPEI